MCYFQRVISIIVSLKFYYIMNISVVQLYVAKKLAKSDELFAEAEKKLDKISYQQLVMSQPVSALSRRFIKECGDVIRRKYALSKKKGLFPKPTVRQWISDLAGDYQADDLLDFFAQAIDYPISRVKKATIGGTLIDRPYLISLVEKLEDATGKALLWPGADAPLAYLGDDVTYEEIAKYFSYGSDVITAKRRKYVELEEPKHLLGRFRRETIAVYRAMADVSDEVKDDDFLQMAVKSVVPAGFSKGDWDLPIFWLEENLGIQMNDAPGCISDATKVSELVDKIVLIRYKKIQGIGC